VATSVPWRRRVYGDLDRIVQMALRKEASRRYASVTQFSADVERFLDGLPVRATADSVSYRMSRFVLRHRLGVSVSSVLALALVVLTVQALSQSARAARERDAARRAEASISGVVGILTSLFETANPTVHPGGDTVRVGELLERAQAKVDSLSNDPLTQAPLQIALGEMHYARGRPDVAAQFLQKAVATLERTPDTNTQMLARATLSLARAIVEFEGRTRALPWYERAVQRYEAAFGPSAPVTDIARREWTTADTLVARRARALERMVSDSALAAVTDTMNRAERIHALGVERFRSGDVIAATPLFEEALRLVDLKLPPDHPTRLLVLGTVASAKYESGAFGEAEVMARARLDEQARRVPVNAVGLAHATEFLAVVQASRGFLFEAESRQRAAVAMWRAALAPSHPSQWNALSNLAVILSARGRHRDALALLDSAETLARFGSKEDRAFIVQLRVDALLRDDRLAEAEALLQETAPYARAFPTTHTLHSGHSWRSAVVAAARGRHEEARNALALFQTALDATLPSAHPQHDGASCLRAALGLAMPNGSPDARAACSRYAAWGLALRSVARLASQPLAPSPHPQPRRQDSRPVGQ
ncbi:MAG: tetratricopeptide repeat protein, partial [Gemmatimonadaceae bacterium]|nr:tetratricopeptide repeat protein [Gemmatimonadaceae bacterium]